VDNTVPGGAAGRRGRAERHRIAVTLAGLVRDVFGNPFKPSPFDAAWRTPQVMAIARTLYEEPRWEEMPVLADALEEAGCADERFLNHCRLPGVHAGGCWLLDLLLEKE
jgi:hypothetical protein